MTVKEFREKQDLKYDHFFNLTSTGISPNYDNMEKFAEEYHQAKLKLLGIGGVSQQRELLEAYTKQIKEDNEFTEEITFQDINKCIASNCG